MKYLFGILFLSIVFMACEDYSKDGLGVDSKTPETPIVDHTISTNFNENVFNKGVEKELLKEIKICNPNETDELDERKSACSPKLFRFFPLTKNGDLKNGFILLVKAGVGTNPLRRVLIFQRERGVLVKVNGFMANLIERKKSTSPYDDLILRFPDKVENNLIHYNCLFQWKDGMYQFKSCEEIDEDRPRPVKAEFKDSMNVVIKGILDRNNFIY